MCREDNRRYCLLIYVGQIWLKQSQSWRIQPCAVEFLHCDLLGFFYLRAQRETSSWGADALCQAF